MLAKPDPSMKLFAADGVVTSHSFNPTSVEPHNYHVRNQREALATKDQMMQIAASTMATEKKPDQPKEVEKDE